MKNLPKEIELRGEATITVEAGDAKGPPKFEMLAYGGGEMRPKTTTPLPHAIVVDLAGLDLVKQNRPALKDHDPKHLVGHTSVIQSNGRELTASGIVSGTGAAAQEVLGAAANGFAWPVSMGAEIFDLQLLKAGQSATVNGRNITGPVYVARKSRLREISFLTIAADDDAVASIAASAAGAKAMTPFAQWLEANGFGQEDSLPDQQKTVLLASFKSATEDGKKPGEAPDLDAVLGAERDKEKKRKDIVDLTAKSLQDNPGQLQIIEALSRQAMEGEWDTPRYELELLRATRPQSSARLRVTSDDGMTGNVIEAALCIAGGLEGIEKSFNEQTLESASKRFRHGLGLGETLMLFARRNGSDSLSTKDPRPILRAAFAEQPMHLMASPTSTYSLPGILANVANRFLKAGFDAVESTWRAIAAIRNVRDFKQISSYTLTGDFKYKKVAPGGKLEHATVGEETYTNQADTYGRMFAIDRRDIINDDLGALTTVPKRLGRGAALKFNEVFWTEFLADHTSADWFPVNNANGNYFSGATVGTNDSRLNIEGLTRGETLFFNQTDPDGQPLAAMPKILLVPNALATPASQLMRDLQIGNNAVDTTYGTGNPHAGKFNVVRSSYLSNAAMGGAYSAVFWYLLADPNDLPFIEACFLNGVESPTVESADADFDSLGIQMRGVHDWGVQKQEYRAAVKSKGAA